MNEPRMAELQYDGPVEVLPVAIMTMLGMHGDKLRQVGEFAASDEVVNTVGEVYERVGVHSNHALIGIIETEHEYATSWRLVIFERGTDGTLVPHNCATAEALLGIFADSREELVDLFGFQFEALEA